MLAFFIKTSNFRLQLKLINNELPN